MTKPNPAISKPTSWAHLSSRVSDPLVLGLAAASFVMGLIFPHDSLQMNATPAVPPDALQGALRPAPAQPRESRFLVEPYPMPGPVNLSALSQRAQDDFTLNGRIPVLYWLMNHRGLSNDWSNERIEKFIKYAETRNLSAPMTHYGPHSLQSHFDALDAHPVKGMNVLVVGSIDPWVEAICLAAGANSTITVDFTKPKVDHPKFRPLSVPELDATDEQFDAVFSYSSLEHDGLGRYGDPLDPNGDIKRMEKIKALVRPGGKLYLGVPNGLDVIHFNAHRVYGRLRFPMLTQGWKLLGTYGDILEDTYKGVLNKTGMFCYGKREPGNMLGCFTQPVHVLTLMHKEE